MASQIQVNEITNELIKPSSPTPDHLKIFKLSLIDQFAPFFRTLIILFFPSTDISIDERCGVLKRSLSETLTMFYPFAGRLRNNLLLDCNDAGAELVLARVHSPVWKFLQKPDSKEMLKLLIPQNNEASKDAVFSSPLLLIRASFFDCGAMSICVRLSHKVGDGGSVCLFLQSWTAMANGLPGLTPRFVSSTLFPPNESLASAFNVPAVEEDVQIKRMVFSGQAIESMRSRLASPSVPKPTRVEALLALIWKALIEADSRSTSVIIQQVNLRNMVVRSFPESCVGNVAWVYKSVADPGVSRTKRDLVVKLRKGFEEFKASREKRIQMGGMSGFIEHLSNLRKDCRRLSVYTASSVCRFPWYGMDFGWGKPSLVGLPSPTTKNIIFLLDSKDGDGIDVWLSLNEEDMAIIENNHELWALRSFIPSAM